MEPKDTKFKKGMIPWNKGKKANYEVWNKGKKNTFTKDTRVIKKCITCNNEFKVYPSYADRRKSCSKKCVPKRQAWNKGLKGFLSGEKHYKWKEDRNSLLKYAGSEERRSPAYKDWRKQVWLRDNFKCRIDNPDCCGRIEVHHILSWSEYPELRYQINNGITLCHAHHPRKRAEEKRLESYFMELVSVSNL